MADLLDDLYAGIYHINRTSLGKVDWANEHHIRVVVGLHDMNSYDSNHLTRLVFLAHDFALRVELDAAGFGYLGLFFTQRSHTGKSFFDRHPTLEQAVADFRKGHQPKAPLDGIVVASDTRPCMEPVARALLADGDAAGKAVQP